MRSAGRVPIRCLEAVSAAATPRIYTHWTPSYPSGPISTSRWSAWTVGERADSVTVRPSRCSAKHSRKIDGRHSGTRVGAATGHTPHDIDAPLVTSVTRPKHQNAEHEPEYVLQDRSLRRRDFLDRRDCSRHRMNAAGSGGSASIPARLQTRESSKHEHRLARIHFSKEAHRLRLLRRHDMPTTGGHLFSSALSAEKTTVVSVVS